LGVHVVAGDVCDSGALDELLKGAHACVHLVGIIREVRGGDGVRPQTFERMHTQATRAVVDGCGRAGVKRYLHMSALGVGPEGKSKYQQTKWEAEQVVRRAGLEWTIFRPSLIHGPDGDFLQMMSDLVAGEVPPYVFLPYFARTRIDMSVPMGAMTFEPASIQPVAVADVAAAFANALQRPESIGEIYNLVGSEELNWQELTEFLRDTLPGGKRGLGTWYVPGAHAAVIARMAGKMGMGSLLPFDEGQAIMATEDSTADTWKMEKDLGVVPTAFRAGVRGYAARV
jgi:NADH dehydrogenase